MQGQRPNAHSKTFTYLCTVILPSSIMVIILSSDHYYSDQEDPNSQGILDTSALILKARVPLPNGYNTSCLSYKQGKKMRDLIRLLCIVLPANHAPKTQMTLDFQALLSQFTDSIVVSFSTTHLLQPTISRSIFTIQKFYTKKTIAMEKSIFVVHRKIVLLLAYPSLKISTERTKINLKLLCFSKTET